MTAAALEPVDFERMAQLVEQYASLPLNACVRSTGQRRPAWIGARTPLTAISPELGKLARTLKQRAADILRYFDHPGTSNGPTEAINGRPEHLRGTALGFRNLAHYIARSLLEAGGFRPQLLHPAS